MCFAARLANEPSSKAQSGAAYFAFTCGSMLGVHDFHRSFFSLEPFQLGEFECQAFGILSQQHPALFTGFHIGVLFFGQQGLQPKLNIAAGKRHPLTFWAERNRMPTDLAEPQRLDQPPVR